MYVCTNYAILILLIITLTLVVSVFAVADGFTSVHRFTFNLLISSVRLAVTSFSHRENSFAFASSQAASLGTPSIITVSCSFSSAMSSECMYGYMWLHNYESLNLYHVYILCNLINTLEIHTCIYLWLPHIHTYICKQVWWLGTMDSMRRGREQ